LIRNKTLNHQNYVIKLKKFYLLQPSFLTKFYFFPSVKWGISFFPKRKTGNEVRSLNHLLPGLEKHRKFAKRYKINYDQISS